MLGLDSLAVPVSQPFKVQPPTPHSRPGGTKGTWLGDEQEEEKWWVCSAATIWCLGYCAVGKDPSWLC